VRLRDNCPCPECLDPGPGQKRFDITRLPNGLGITLVEDAGDTVRVTFGPDQHTSVFSSAWLARRALDADGGSDGDGRTEAGEQLWRPAALADRAAAALPARRRRGG
jgi:gamma-butyrobetaine dioxygenase